MVYSWNDPDLQDLWTLTAEQSVLLPGMTNKGMLGFAVQLKFMEMHGRFPESHDEIDPNAMQWLASQLKTTSEVLLSYKFVGRQGRRHRRAIRIFLGFRPSTITDLVNGYAITYCHSIHKLIMVAIELLIGFARKD